MLATWTLVVFLNGQPFVYPKEIATFEECETLERQALALILPNEPDRPNNVSCGRTDLSVFKPVMEEGRHDKHD